MPQVAMEVPTNPMHNGYHHQAMIGHLNMSPPGSKVNGHHHHDSQDDVDLDALVNGMSSFPAYSDERPLLESMENLSNMQDIAHIKNTSTCNCGSGKRSSDSSHIGRIIPKPRLDWAWRSKSLSVEKSEDESSSSSGDVTLSSSYPERGFGDKSMEEVPDPFPDLGGSPPGIKSCEESFIRQKFRDFKKLHFELNSDLNLKQASIKVYSEDGTCKVCQVGPNHTVQDVCSMMVSKNHTTDDKSWALIEQLPDLELERTMEDHEGILAVFKRWPQGTSNRFHFRKDFRKYEIFQNPGQFFPAGMTGKSSDDEAECVVDKGKKPKPPSLNLLASTEKIPEIQGYLQAKEGHKRSWKKMYFILRESGLYYSTKGNSKDPRHLQLYVQFSDVNIYQATNGKKRYHAPTDYTFCTKPGEGKSDLKDMKCFCAEDEKSRQCWLATMRLVKYGKQLQENYQTAMDRALKSKEAYSQIALNNVKNCTERAAIDFSGNQGRVIDNPSEALSIARQEGYTWRKRGGQRSFDSALSSPRAQQTSSPRFIFNPHGSSHHSSSSSSSSNGHSSTSHGSPRSSNGHGSPRHSSGSPRHSPRSSSCRMGGFSSGIHMTQPWFYSGLTREETHELVGRQGLVDGLFLVRESQRIPGAYVLSFCHNKKVRHYQINIVYESSQTFYTLDEGNTKFNDLVQLVEFYQVNAGGLPTRLLHVCSSV